MIINPLSAYKTFWQTTIIICFIKPFAVTL